MLYWGSIGVIWGVILGLYWDSIGVILGLYQPPRNVPLSLESVKRSGYRCNLSGVSLVVKPSKILFLI